MELSPLGERDMAVCRTAFVMINDARDMLRKAGFTPPEFARGDPLTQQERNLLQAVQKWPCDGDTTLTPEFMREVQRALGKLLDR